MVVTVFVEIYSICNRLSVYFIFFHGVMLFSINGKLLLKYIAAQYDCNRMVENDT